MERVRAGQPVAHLVSPQLAEWQRDWLLAEAQARLARDKWQRDEQLLAEGVIAEHRRNESRSQHDMAQLAARERRQALRLAGLSDATLIQALAQPAAATLSPRLTLVAPAAGTVLEQVAVPGQRLEAGAPLLRMAREGRVALELQATRQQAQAVRIGDAVQVEGCSAPARVVAIATQMVGSNQSVLLRAEWVGATNCVRVAQFVEVRVAATGGSAGSAVRVPRLAVVQHAGQSWVFVREAGGFRSAPVQELGTSTAGVDISGPVPAGSLVAVSGIAAIKGAWLGLGEQSPKAETVAGSPKGK
jgi:multidrug resistance efflux pump